MYRGDVTTSEPLGAEILSVAARLTRWASRTARFSVPLAQARLLAQIEEHEPARIGDLARADHCTQPTMTTQVRKLEQQGLAVRAADPTDARAVLISLTERGRRTLGEVRQARVEAVAPLVDKLSRAERARLEGAVLVLRDFLEAVAEPASPAVPETE